MITNGLAKDVDVSLLNFSDSASIHRNCGNGTKLFDVVAGAGLAFDNEATWPSGWLWAAEGPLTRCTKPGGIALLAYSTESPVLRNPSEPWVVEDAFGMTRRGDHGGDSDTSEWEVVVLRQKLRF